MKTEDKNKRAEKFHLRPRKILAAGLAALMTSESLLCATAEADFWADRAQAARRVKADPSFDVHAFSADARRQQVFLASLAGSDAASAGGLVTRGLSAALAAPSLGSALPARQAALVATLLPALSIHGTLRDVQAPAAGPASAVVICVQDVHGHAAAQRSIAALLGEILDRTPEALVGLEGAAGPLALDGFRSPSTDANRTAAAFLFNAGLLSGAEKALLCAARSPRAFGVEDAGLYLKNVGAVREGARRRASWAARRGETRRIVEGLKKEVFPPALKALDEKMEARAAGTLSLGDHADFLVRQNPPAFLAGHPEMARFLSVLAMEKSLDMAAVKEERARLMERLVLKMDKPALDGLLQASLAFRAGSLAAGPYHAYLKNAVARAGMSLESAPRFAAYVRYVLAADALKPEALWRDLAAAEEQTARNLCALPRQREVLDAALDAGFLDKLLDLSLTTDDWRRYEGRREEIHRLPVRLARLLGAAPPAAFSGDDLKPFETFYQTAEARNGALVDNLMREAADGGGTPLAVLVAGGFHTAGVARLLKGKNALVLTVAPKMEPAGDAAPGAFALFTRDKTPIEEIFESPRISLAETLSVAPIGAKPAARAVKALAPAVEGLFEKAEANGGPALARLPATEAGETLVLLDRSDGESGGREIVAAARGAREVLSRVDAGDGWRVSVLQRPPSAAKRMSQKLALAAQRSRRVYYYLARWARSPGVKWVLAGAVGLTLLLIDYAAPTGAWAYTFARDAAGLVFTPGYGEHLWGAAREILRMAGVDDANGPQVWEVVQKIFHANPQMSDPSLIFSGHEYRVPEGLVPAAAAPASPDVVVAGKLSYTLGAEAPAPVAAPAAVSVVAERPFFLSGVVSSLMPWVPWFSAGIFGVLFARAYSKHHAPLFSPSRRTPRMKLDNFRRAPLLGNISLTRALMETLKSPWLGYVALGWGLMCLFPGFGPFAWANGQLGQAGFDSFLKILSAFAVFLAFRFVFALRQQLTATAPEKLDPALEAWRALLARREPWTSLETNQAIEYARAGLRNYRFQIQGVDQAKNAVAYHMMSRDAQETALRLKSFVEDHPGIAPRSQDELMAKALWFESLAQYAVRARKLSVGSVINVEHIRAKYGGTVRYKEILGGYVRHPLRSALALFFEPERGEPLIQSLKEVIARFVARPLFGMNRRLAEENAKFRVRATELMALGNRLEPALYDDVPGRAEAMRRLLFESDLTDKEKPGLPGVWDGRNLVAPFLALLFTVIYSFYVLQKTTTGLPVVIVAALIGGVGITALIHRFFIAKGFWDPAYHTESQKLIRLRKTLRGFWDGRAAELPSFERLAFDNEIEKSQEAFREELSLAPATDAVVLVARDEAQYRHFQSLAAASGLSAPRLFPLGVPVLVLRQKGAGTGSAQAEAFAALRERWPAWRSDHPRLADRELSDARCVVLFAEGTGVAAVQEAFPGVTDPLSGAPLTVFGMQLMNAYKAARHLRKNEEGGLAFFTLDRPYVGPVDVASGAVHLLSAWKPETDVTRHDWGLFVTDAGGRITKIVGEAGYGETNKYMREGDRLNKYAAGPAGRSVQAYAGAGIVSFKDPAVFALYDAVAGDVLRVGADDHGQAPPVDFLDDILIPLRLLCSEGRGNGLYTYLGARGDLSSEKVQARGGYFVRLFNRYEESFRRLGGFSSDLLVTQTAPAGSANFVRGGAQELENIFPPAEAPKPSADPLGWLEGKIHERSFWIGWAYRAAPRVVTVVVALALAARAAAGAPLSPNAQALLTVSGLPGLWEGGKAFFSMMVLSKISRVAPWLQNFYLQLFVGSAFFLAALPAAASWGDSLPWGPVWLWPTALLALVWPAARFSPPAAQALKGVFAAGAGAWPASRTGFWTLSVLSFGGWASLPLWGVLGDFFLAADALAAATASLGLTAGLARPQIWRGVEESLRRRAGAFVAKAEELVHTDRLMYSVKWSNVPAYAVMSAVAIWQVPALADFGSGLIVLVVGLMLMDKYYDIKSESIAARKTDELIGERIRPLQERIGSLEDLLRGSAGSSPAPGLGRPGAAAGLPSRASPWRPEGRGADVTDHVFDNPRDSGAQLIKLIRRLDDTKVRQELAKAVLRLEGPGALRANYLKDFERANVRRYAEALGSPVPRGSPSSREALEDRVNARVLSALDHQLAVAHGTAAEGLAPLEEMRQAAYLLGLLKRWTSLMDREKFLEVLEASLGISGEVDRALVRSGFSRGLNERSALYAPSFAEAPAPEGTVSVYRVTELFSTVEAAKKKQAVILKHLKRAVRLFDAGSPPAPVLLVNGPFPNGRPPNPDQVKETLRRAFGGAGDAFKAKLDAYLSKAAVLSVADDRFRPEEVRARVHPAGGGRWDLDLFTADAAALLFDSRRNDGGYRVLLMDVVGGEIKSLDVLDLMRRSEGAVRVVSSNA